MLHKGAQLMLYHKELQDIQRANIIGIYENKM